MSKPRSKEVYVSMMMRLPEKLRNLMSYYSFKLSVSRNNLLIAAITKYLREDLTSKEVIMEQIDYLDQLEEKSITTETIPSYEEMITNIKSSDTKSVAKEIEFQNEMKEKAIEANAIPENLLVSEKVENIPSLESSESQVEAPKKRGRKPRQESPENIKDVVIDVPIQKENDIPTQPSKPEEIELEGLDFDDVK